MKSHKRCTVCGELKPLSAFYRNSTYTDGREGKCKKCRKAYQQQWREDNREQHREYSRQYHHAHRDERLAYYAEWLEDNADKKAEATKRWRERNPDRVLAMRKVQNARRRALEEQADGDYTPAEWCTLKRLYGDRCLKCGKQAPEVKITPDHIVPLALGGSNNIENIQPLCWSCNAAKGAQIADYRPYAGNRIDTACATSSATSDLGSFGKI